MHRTEYIVGFSIKSTQNYPHPLFVCLFFKLALNYLTEYLHLQDEAWQVWLTMDNIKIILLFFFFTYFYPLRTIYFKDHDHLYTSVISSYNCFPMNKIVCFKVPFTDLCPQCDIKHSFLCWKWRGLKVLQAPKTETYTGRIGSK